MPTFTFECRGEAEYAALQQAANFLAEMHQLAQSAPAGGVLQAIESHALDAGRQLLRDALGGAAQARIDADEVKGGRHAPARARPRSATRGGTAAT